MPSMFCEQGDIPGLVHRMGSNIRMKIVTFLQGLSVYSKIAVLLIVINWILLGFGYWPWDVWVGCAAVVCAAVGVWKVYR